MSVDRPDFQVRALPPIGDPGVCNCEAQRHLPERFVGDSQLQRGVEGVFLRDPRGANTYDAGFRRPQHARVIGLDRIARPISHLDGQLGPARQFGNVCLGADDLRLFFAQVATISTPMQPKARSARDDCDRRNGFRVSHCNSPASARSYVLRPRMWSRLSRVRA